MSTALQDLSELVEFMAKALVDEPSVVKVEHTEKETGFYNLELHVDKQDLGKVIGKQGRTAHALRTILGAASVKIGLRATLEIME